jgi:hypothetical protein
MSLVRAVLFVACQLLALGCGTFGDDFDDVKPEESAYPFETDAGADAGNDS